MEIHVKLRLLGSLEGEGEALPQFYPVRTLTGAQRREAKS